MVAYEILLDLVKEYFIELGYNSNYIDDFLSPANFCEIISIRLANANVMIKNKTDHSSHQTHIAVTGEAIDFFYPPTQFEKMDNVIVETREIYVSDANLVDLKNQEVCLSDTMELQTKCGVVTIGKRTQKQLQLSKRNSSNSPCFNELRLGLFENDLLVLIKERESKKIFAVGIPQTFYLDYIPNYANKYETNTYLRIANKK